MSAIDNTNMLDYRGDQGTSEFTPGVDYVYDSTAKEVDFTDATTSLPSGVSLLRTHVRVHDKFGNTAIGSIENPDGSDSPGMRTATVSVAALDASRGLDITATVVADDGRLVADGGAYNIGASGSLGAWDKQKNGSPDAV